MTMTRRSFVRVAAAGAAMLGNAPKLFAQTYDLIIKGGRVVDPSLRFNAVRDVAISGGRIAAVETGIAADATETIDASGKLVVPGLIDIHTHAARTPEGPSMCLADGVTGFIDGGSLGADGIAQTIANAASAPQPGRVLINIGRAGILPEGDTMDIDLADVAAARDAIAANPDFIVGVKARLTRNVSPDDLEVLRRAKEAASSFNLPVMIHMGQSSSALSEIMDRLDRGDIVTHMFAPPPNSIVDGDGRILPEVLAARRRGVWFDVGNGTTGHMRWDIIEQVMQTGFWPDTFSTDWNVNSRTTSVVDFPNCMSKFLGLGMSVDDVVACATLNPSRVFPVFNDRGTLNVGAPADVALLELREGSFEYLDNYDNTLTGRQRLFPSGTVLAGATI